jgi:hypothetical protein
MNPDFFVGYIPKMPPGLGRWIARIVGGLVAAGLVAGGLLTLNQAPFADSRFEYGVLREYTGVMEEWPYPILTANDSSFLLVGPGKHGIAGEVKGLQGKTVHLKATAIERKPDRMLEVVPESIREAGPAVQKTTEPVPLGLVTLRGEIVDTKCYLGVMNPGNGKVHRDCAVRCISGGAPPAFVARDASGETRVLLLVGSDGRPLSKEILSFVAEPLEISGELVRSGSSLILKTDPAQHRRQTE